jgi:hypothetical protein
VRIEKIKVSTDESSEKPVEITGSRPSGMGSMLLTFWNFSVLSVFVD